MPFSLEGGPRRPIHLLFFIQEQEKFWQSGISQCKSNMDKIKSEDSVLTLNHNLEDSYDLP